MMTISDTVRPMARLLLGLFIAVNALAMTATADEAAPRKALKVCADPNAMPMSNEAKEGYENKIANLFAADLKLPVEYTFFPQRMGFYRNTLKDTDTADGSYKCDLVISAPEHLDFAANTKPYFYSTYVMIYAKGRGLDDIKSQEDLANLPPERIKKLRIGVFDRGPGTKWVAMHNLMDEATPYQSMTADLSDYPGRIIEQDMVNNKIDLAIVWGPIGGYYAKKIKNPQLVVIPMHSEPGIKFTYGITMAVRHGEKAWMQQINDLISKHESDIKAILADYGVPTVDGPMKTAKADD